MLRIVIASIFVLSSGCAYGSTADISQQEQEVMVPAPSKPKPAPAEDKHVNNCTVKYKQVVHQCTLYALDCDDGPNYYMDCPPPPLPQTEQPDPI